MLVRFCFNSLKSRTTTLIHLPPPKAKLRPKRQAPSLLEKRKEKEKYILITPHPNMVSRHWPVDDWHKPTPPASQLTIRTPHHRKCQPPLPQQRPNHPCKPPIRSSNQMALAIKPPHGTTLPLGKERCTDRVAWPLATHRPIVPLLQLLQMRGLRARRRRQLAKALQRTLRSVFAGVVDVLPVVPEAGVDRLRANGDGAGPRGAAA
jgi:hypothetical protein